MPARIRKGDTVEVIAGRNKGTQGMVLMVDARDDRVTVEHVNMAKRHTRPTAQFRQGGIIEKEQPIHLSNVALVH
jgi:large subunit ribosomal protein L24